MTDLGKLQAKDLKEALDALPDNHEVIVYRDEESDAYVCIIQNLGEPITC